MSSQQSQRCENDANSQNGPVRYGQQHDVTKLSMLVRKQMMQKQQVECGRAGVSSLPHSQQQRAAAHPGEHLTRVP